MGFTKFKIENFLIDTQNEGYLGAKWLEKAMLARSKKSSSMPIEEFEEINGHKGS